MSKDAQINRALDRVVDVFGQRPSAALSTATCSAELEQGLECRFTQGEHQVIADMPEIIGGGGAHPTPGFYARAGIACCVCIGIKMTAVTAGLALERIRVELETDFDDSALFGMGQSSAAPLATRLKVYVQSNLPDERVAALVDTALGRDPWYLALLEAQRVDVELGLEGERRG